MSVEFEGDYKTEAENVVEESSSAFEFAKLFVRALDFEVGLIHIP